MRFLRLGVSLAACLAALAGCRQKIESHCAWQADPAGACAAKSGGAAPFCSKCTAVNDGCVASESELEEGCLEAEGGDGESTSGNTASTGETTDTSGTDSGTTDGETTDGETTDGETTDGETTDGETTDTGGPDCGNMKIDPGESCDGDNLNGKSCEDLGRPPGTLICDEFCGFDLSGCCKANGMVCEADDDCCSGKCDMLISNKCTNL